MGGKRPSSAGYRLPAGGPRDSSGGPSGPGAAGAPKAPGVGAAGIAARGRRDGDVGDRVKWERAWTESVTREQRAVHTWKKKWSFLTNYNEQGELVFPDDPETNPETSPETSSSIAAVSLGSDAGEGGLGTLVSGGHHVTMAQSGPGGAVSSDGGRQLSRLDYMLSPHHHKRRLPADMVPC